MFKKILKKLKVSILLRYYLRRTRLLKYEVKTLTLLFNSGIISKNEYSQSLAHILYQVDKIEKASNKIYKNK